MTVALRWPLAFLLILGVVTPAAAYVGPGAGLSLMGALWGLVVAIGAALGFVLLWPFRRMIRNRRAAQAPKAESKRAGPPPAP
jgi:membrane protein implicated in regulation of membrane protease activity